MSNYTIDNLISATPAAGVPAIRIGNEVFPLTITSGGSAGSSPFGLVQITSAGISSIIGREITSYSSGTYYASSATSGLSGYEGAGSPTTGSLYVTSGGYALGNPVSDGHKRAIPTGFTSNTSISGYVVSQSTGDGEYPEAFVVFNLDTTTPDYAWWSGDVGGVYAGHHAWISIQVPQPFIPTQIFIANEIYSPENFLNAEFQGSNDGENWTTLHSITNNPDSAGYQQYIPISASSAYSNFRMLFTSAYGNGVSLQAFTIYRGGVEVIQ